MSLITGLVSYWKLDGNSTDSAGANSGVDTAISYSNANGRINNGGGFNGSTSFITNGSATGLPSGSSSRTVILWIKTSVAADQEMLAYGTNTSGNFFALAYINQGTGRRFYFAGNAHDVDSGIDVGDGNWHQCAVTYDGTTIRTYVDAVAGGSAAEALSTSGTALFIGAQSAAVFNVNGSMDEIGIWNRVLTTSEISQLYNSGKGLQYPFNSGFFEFQ